MGVMEMLRALMGRHLLRGHAVLVVHSLRRCSLWARLGVTVLLVLSGALLIHGGVDIGVVHGRVGHVCETILGSRRWRRGSMSMRAKVRADATDVISRRGSGDL